MKKSIGFVALVVGIPMIGVGAWYVGYTRGIEREARGSSSEADRYVAWARDQKMIPVEIVATAPPETPPKQTLYVSGSAPSMGAWDSAGAPMQKQADGKYHATLDVMSGIEYGFKITRGTWGTVERGPNGAEIDNHTFVADKSGAVNVDVASWVDGGKAVPGRITLTGDIRQHKKFHSGILNIDRNITVYLPPGYDKDEQQRFSVLYMHDGQNLFDEATSFAGVEWKADETAQKLITEGMIEPMIIVGIWNSEQRNAEFTPGAGSASTRAARGDLYGRFVVEELKPFIDHLYRTRGDRAHTALAGSSMGGLITLHMARMFKGTFGSIAVLTPWLRVEGRPLLDVWGQDVSWLKGTRVFMEMGSSGGSNYPGPAPMDDARQFVQKIQSAGIQPGNDFQFVEVEGGEHNEAVWAGQFDKALLFLFGKKGDTQ